MNKRPQILFVMAVLLILPACSSSPQSKVCFDSKCYGVEVVQTEQARAKGLMDRPELESNAGMLFIFEENGLYPFWMKDTLIPLDIIWLDETGRIVHMEQNVPPCRKDPCPSYNPSRGARYVVEVNAGEAAAHNITVGQQVQIRM